MLKIRLQRTGRRNNPYFRVILTDSKRGPKSGKYIEMLGSYDPKQGEILFKEDRVKYWMSVGAQTSDTVHNFLVDKKVLSGKKVNVLPKKSPTKKRKELKGGGEEAKGEEAKAEATVAEAEVSVEEKKEETKLSKAKSASGGQEAVEEKTEETKLSEAKSEEKVEEKAK